MAENIKLTVEIDKDIVKGVLVMGGGLKSGIISSAVKEWINEHDSVELPVAYLARPQNLEQQWQRLPFWEYQMNLKKI